MCIRDIPAFEAFLVHKVDHYIPCRVKLINLFFYGSTLDRVGAYSDLLPDILISGNFFAPEPVFVSPRLFGYEDIVFCFGIHVSLCGVILGPKRPQDIIRVYLFIRAARQADIADSLGYTLSLIPI